MSCFLFTYWDLLSVYNPTQFMLRFLISFLISFLLVVLFVHFYCPFTHANFMQKFFPTYIYIGLLFYFTTHLIMTEARSKRKPRKLWFKLFKSKCQSPKATFLYLLKNHWLGHLTRTRIWLGLGVASVIRLTLTCSCWTFSFPVCFLHCLEYQITSHSFEL